MNIIFDSQIYPDTLVADYAKNSKVILDYAAHNLCKAIYIGIKQNSEDIRLINAPNIGSFPFLYRTPRVSGCKLEDGVSIPFWNISFLKRGEIRKKMAIEIKKELARLRDDQDVCLLLYNFRCLPLIKELKEKYPKLKVAMVVTDLPEFMLKPNNGILGLGSKVISPSKSSYEGIEEVNGFILLAPAMREKLPNEGKPWIQIEGIYNSDTLIEKQIKEDNKTILYTGNLGLRYGIGELLEAFHQIESPDYRLWICGGGDGLEEVKRYSSMDSRIEYKGILPRYEVLRMQKKATALINPRNSADEYTRYSFPSKTMEYLASGTPVIMSHLKSIPKEYDEHIYYVDDESIDGFKNKIIEICSKPADELRAFGESASQFIFENKTPEPQMKKVINFINTI